MSPVKPATSKPSSAPTNVVIAQPDDAVQHTSQSSHIATTILLVDLIAAVGFWAYSTTSAINVNLAAVSNSVAKLSSTVTAENQQSSSNLLTVNNNLSVKGTISATGGFVEPTVTLATNGSTLAAGFTVLNSPDQSAVLPAPTTPGSDSTLPTGRLRQQQYLLHRLT